MKKGDRVRVIENIKEPSIGTFYNIGDTGTIIEIENGDVLNLGVQFDEGSLDTTGIWWIMGQSLELIKEEQE